MNDVIYRQDAIDALDCINGTEEVLRSLPSAQSDSCNGCKWENAFGYGECHHCKRRYDDMYEVENGKTT